VLNAAKIAFITYFFPPRTIGGAAYYAEEFTSALAELGHEVTVVIPNAPTLLRDKGKIDLRPINIVESRGMAAISFAISLASTLQNDDFDIIHSQGGAGLFLGRLDVETIHHYPMDRSEMPHLALSVLSSFRAKSIFTVSEKSRTELLAHSLFSVKKIQVIPNGISLEFISAVQNLRSGNNERKSRKAVLHINTTLQKRKNLPLALETFACIRKSYPDCVMNIVGPSGGRSIVSAEASRMNIQNAINYFDHLSTKALVELYRQSDVLLVTSMQEGFGFPLLEAVATGLPFVSTDVGIASELSHHGYGFIARKEEEFPALVSKSLESGIYAKQNGLRFIAENFSWRKSAEKAVQLYAEIMKRR
jgi:glycosyltransferase involved in cell wall biosynthesis